MNKTKLTNFGGNVQFRPAEIFTPNSVDELLEKLAVTNSKIRVIGSKHAWNSGIETEELIVDLGKLSSIRIDSKNDQPFVVVGGGCVMRDLVDELTRRGFALPTSGLILEQTIAGATATGTHGSGKPSLSHFLTAVRMVHYKNGEPVATWISGGNELKAARCSLGCLGIVVEIQIPLIPIYSISEDTVRCRSMAEALDFENEYSLQQIFILPTTWRVYAQRRKLCANATVSPTSWLYRKYWNWGLCFGFIAVLKLMLTLPFSSQFLRFYYRYIAPCLLLTNWEVKDRSDKLMVIAHESFRHLEIELFVRDEHLLPAFEFLVEILRFADDAKYTLSSEAIELLTRQDLLESVYEVGGIFTHHCPICVRKVLADATLISMTAGHDDWYSISLITYGSSLDSFSRLAEFVAIALFKCFRARVHWGKWFPYGAKTIVEQYSQLTVFRNVCQRFDPDGVFQNRFTEKLFVEVKESVVAGDLVAGQSNKSQEEVSGNSKC